MYGKKNVLVIGGNTSALNAFSSRYDTEIISSVHFIDTVLFTFVPDLIVFDSVYDADVRAVRSHERLTWVPVLILLEDISYLANFKLISETPGVILCNTSVSGNTDFLLHVQKMVEKKSAWNTTKASCFVKKALLFINKNVHRAFTRAEIGEALGLSQDYLSRIFKQEMGMCLWDYVLALRLQEAKALLCETMLSAKEIAARTGFSSAAYFSRQFQRYFLLSPGMFRKRLGGSL